MVDAGHIVQISISYGAKEATSLSIPHSSLITDLCQHAGVTWEDTKELLNPKIPIDLNSGKPRNEPVPAAI